MVQPDSSPGTNPYQASPLDETVSRHLPTLTWTTLGRLLAVVGFCTTAGGLLGLAVGTLLAIVAPGYYIEVFGLEDFNRASPLAMGIGLGLTQGIAGGATVGVAIDAIAVWYLTRTSPQVKGVE
jgi:hypothetical protein